jgi:signal transduction histidine kinase
MNDPRPTLLVVDDEPEVLRSLYDLFRIRYRVLTCERGADALKILDAPGDIHVVMSDQKMPEMTGVQVLHHAAKVRPEATRLLFTAYADIKAVIDAINQGSIFRYITKPWDTDELEVVVRQAVEQHDLIVERTRLVAELQETNRRLVEANRLKAAFIEVASHELNTPVSVVLGMTELWKWSQAETASPAERGWVDRIHHAGRRLAATVERMLKLLRTDQLDHTLDFEPTELAPLIRETVAELAPFLRAREQKVQVELDPGLGVAEVDRQKLSDIVTNLMVNAIKFTPDGGTVRLIAGPDGPDWIQFRVVDQGLGIEPAERRHLFEPFFTGFDTMHHSSGEYQYRKRGIGLGLCLVKTFAELHGGRVEVESAPGCGSAFGFRLPRRRRQGIPTALAAF